MAKKITILGATGSIGTSSLDIVRQFPEQFRVWGLSCKRRVELLAQQIEEFHPEVVVVDHAEQAAWLKDHLARECPRILLGSEGLIEIAQAPEVELVVSGIVGAAGLAPTYAAIEAGKTIALANKEPMVIAGELMMKKAAETSSQIVPADSEHNAIFQSLMGHDPHEVEKLILTASGGPFRDKPLEEFESITLQEALKHPNWEMGQKITIDSATMMNKGLEIIEARWLFDIPVEQIEVVIHRQSIVHSAVAYCDGSFIAQMGLPDMRVPLAFCLSYPKRLPLNIPKMHMPQLGLLDFEPVQFEKYPSLTLAIQAAKWGGAAPAILNAANEVIVEHYLKEELHFLDIAKLLEQVMTEFYQLSPAQNPSFLSQVTNLSEALQADQWGRQQAETFIQEMTIMA